MDLNELLSSAKELPAQLDSWINQATDWMPADVSLLPVLKLILILAAVSMGLSLLGRLIFGKASALTQSISSGIGILLIYVLSVIIYTFKPWSLENLLSPLPYVAFQDEYLIVLPFQGADFAALCDRALSMVILAFLVNLLDDLLPRGEHIVLWYISRVALVCVSFVLHFALNWAINTYLPNVLTTYAPVILVCVLLGLLLVGVANVILSALLIAVNPVVGAIYAFFFSNKVGKQLSKAVLTTVLVTAVFVLLERFGYSVIAISFSALPSYIPLLAALLMLWYVAGHTL